MSKEQLIEEMLALRDRLAHHDDSAPDPPRCIIEGVIKEQNTAELRLTEEERQRLLTELHRRTAEIDTMFSSMKVGVAIYDTEGQIISVNRAGMEIRGYSESDLNLPFATRLETFRVETPEGKPVLPEETNLARAMKGETVLGYEMRNRLKNGATCWILASSAPIRTENGQILGAVSVFSDITERKQMEEELRRSRDDLEQRVQERTAAVTRLAAAVENVTEGIIITDSLWHVEYANTAFTRVSGYTRDEVIGREVGFLRSQTVDQTVYDRGRQLAEIGLPKVFRYPIRKKDGTNLTVETIISAIRDKGGEITNFVFVWRDVSEQLRLEEQLRQAQKMEAVGTLAGGIAHDFNNMLAVILGNAEMALDDTDDNEGVKRNIEQIVKAAMRSRDLVKQILVFSRKSGGERKALKMGPLIRETAHLLRGSLPSTIEIEVAIHTDSDTVVADPSQIEQVLMNLATNAAHAMRDDGGVLAISLSDAMFHESDLMPESDVRPGRYVKLAVRDTGTGIPKKIRSRIFEPFFSTKKRGEGTGMGLSVVFGIVKNHRGAITVDSKVGSGSTFSVFFPVFIGASDEEEPNRDVTLARGNERILLVDDEPAVVTVVSDTLTRLGYEVTIAGGGVDGWKKFEDAPQSFDLVVTDHVMPELTGTRLAEKILAVRSDLPIIMFTGYSEPVSTEKAKAAGISEFLMKPVAKKALAETVRRVLDSRKRRS